MDKMAEISQWARKQLDNGVSKQKVKQFLWKNGYGTDVLAIIDELESKAERELCVCQVKSWKALSVLYDSCKFHIRNCLPPLMQPKGLNTSCYTHL